MGGSGDHDDAADTQHRGERHLTEGQRLAVEEVVPSKDYQIGAMESGSPPEFRRNAALP